jgi:hypothetical protein
MLKAKRGEVKNKERRKPECRNSPDPRGDRSHNMIDGAVSLNHTAVGRLPEQHQCRVSAFF